MGRTDRTRVLVTGVRGTTGTPLARRLTERGLEVRGGSSDPSRVRLPGVVPTRFSWDDPSGWDPALADVDAVFVVRPDRADAPELVGALLARADPSTHVVLLSERAADRTGPEGWAVRTEAVVREGRQPWTVLRPSWFMQVLGDDRFFRRDVVAGRLPFPGGDARLAWIDAEDIAAVAVEALLGDGQLGEVLELSGPESLSLPETADLLGRSLGRPVVHADLDVDEALEGSDGFQRELDELTFRRVLAGDFAAVTDTVARVTGREAGTLGAFLRRQSWDDGAGPRTPAPPGR